MSGQTLRSRQRHLHLESLEGRRLLAGDLCGRELASQSVQAESVFSTSDAAGSTFSTAANLGEIDGTIRRNGRLNWFDQSDVVRFEIGDSSQLNIALDQLSGDADLHVFDARGNAIGSSTRNGSRSETLAGQLPEGTYFVAITATTFWNLNYRISFQVDAIARDPIETPPVDGIPTGTSPETPANTTPVSAPERVVPLADVADFGGRQDWNLNAVAAPESWAAGYTGQGVTVAVIDTGVDLDHADLVQNLYVNPGEIAGNGVDDDGNGFVDDVSGYDFVSQDARPDDLNGHGTHVAGTIAAANNGRGATGVAPDAKILPIRVLNESGSGSDFNVARGIRYAADLGADIINLSLGGGSSTAIARAIEYATTLGSLVIAAAGNESAAVPSYPARYSAASTSVLSVGAHDQIGNLARFSNEVGGSGAVQVDAPGVGIYSTYLNGRYATLSGTSMASPHVAGLAALTLSANPRLTSPELRELLASGAVGSSIGSDSLGKATASVSVAYAAAGLVTARDATSNLADNNRNSTRVRTTGGAFANPDVVAASDYLNVPNTPTAMAFAESLVESSLTELPTSNPIAMTEAISDEWSDQTMAADEWFAAVGGEDTESDQGATFDSDLAADIRLEWDRVST